MPGGGGATSPDTVGIVLPNSAQTVRKPVTARVWSMFQSMHKKNRGWFDRYAILHVSINNQCAYRKRVHS